MATGTVSYGDKKIKSTVYPDGTIKVGGHRNWRNNNPGNIKAGSYTDSHGAIGRDSGNAEFAVYNSMDDGYQAQADLLQSGNYKDLTLGEAIYRWSPPSENNSAGYVSVVSNTTGISSNKKMSDMTDEEMNAIVRSMSDHEGMKNGQGTVIAGADVNGNIATGGHVIDDPFAAGGDGGGTPGHSEPGTGGYNPNCSPLNTPQTSSLNRVAQVEGNGQFTQEEIAVFSTNAISVKGRYLLSEPIAIGLLKETAYATSTASAKEMWELCGSSVERKCVTLQNDIAGRNIINVSRGLTGNQNKFWNLYLRWKVGIGFANSILVVDSGNGQITNPIRIEKMDNQVWMVDDPSDGNTNKFLDNLKRYIEKKGVNPNASV